MPAGFVPNAVLKDVTELMADLIVLDENILGYTLPNPAFAGIIQASVLKGATTGLNAGYTTTLGKTIRLATEKDFEAFNVHFEGYKKDAAFNFKNENNE